MSKNILLADCSPEEVQSFAEELTYDGSGFCIHSHVSNWKRTGAVSELKRYGTYFAVGLRYFLKRDQYQMIVGWQQFYALIFCFFCALFHVKKCTKVVALNYTYKEKNGSFSGLYRWFMGKCMDRSYLDYIHVPSEEYADSVATQFNFPRDRIIVTNFGINDCYTEFSVLPCPEFYEKDGYALAIGRSNRDFDFLIHAWEGVDYPLVIISDKYKGTTELKQVRIFDNIAGEESYPWIANCGLMVIPIDEPSICSGDTVLLTGMAVKRKIVVTKPSTLAEMYIVDGENALLAEKNLEQFKMIVEKALYDPHCENMGEHARESFLREFSRRSMGKRIAKIIQ